MTARLFPLAAHTPAETAALARIEAAPAAEESWTRKRCGIRDCDQFGTERVDMPESWYLMCPLHAAEYVALTEPAR